MSRRSSGLQGYPKPEPIDVDKYWDNVGRHQVLNLEDDGFEPISAQTFDRESMERSEQASMRHSKSVDPPPPPAAASGSRAAQPAQASTPSSRSSSSNVQFHGTHNPATHSKHPPQAANTNVVGNISRQNNADVSMRNVNAIASHSHAQAQAYSGLSTMSPPPRRMPNGVNHPSQIGDAVQQIRHQQQMQQQKRPSPSPQITGSQKRRKLDTPPASAPVASSSKLVTIPVGPPGRRSLLSKRMPSDSRSDASPAPAAKNQGVKRNLGTIDLTSDGEENQKIPSPARKKQKQKQTNPSQPQDLPYIVISDSSEDEGPDVVMKPIPQSDGTSKWKVEDIPPESATQHLPEPAFAPAPAPGPELALPLYDEDDESDWDPIGDIYDSARWNSSTYHLEDEEDEADRLDIARLQIGEWMKSPESPVSHIHPDTSKWPARPPKRSVGSPVEFVWDKLRAAGNVHVRPHVRLQRALTMPSYARPWNLDFDLHKVKMQHSFKKAPGSINKIEQNGDWTVIASASVGGLPDAERDERAMAYNRPGSLLTWGAGGLDMPSGHTKVDPATRDPVKYYAVHDVKFDPLGTTIVSSGADQKVRVWNLTDAEVDEAPGVDLTSAPENKSRWRNDDYERFHCVPHDIVFKPESPILAVAEKSCHVYRLTSEGGSGKRLETHSSFRLHPRNKPHTIGSMAWGTGSTKDHLFISSEPDPSVQVDVPFFDGVHKVYNVEKNVFEYELDAKEAGDVMAIDSTGSLLALSTRGAENTHILRLYDIQRRKSKATSTIHLETFEQRYLGFEGEVNCAAFSPDGLYLALGRNDNRVHVYDVRMLVRGPLLDYGHWGESRVSGEGDCLYGVVKAQWMWSEATRRNALATGGEDGCVRLWNPLLSGDDKENGMSIARMNSDIAHFSIGDRFKGEHRLVAGDSSGEVMIFNNIII